MKKFTLFFLSCILAAAVGVAHAQQQITVAVAANMQYAFHELQAAFEKASHIQVQPVVGASGNLTQQIMQGAPFDVFLAADTTYPHQLVEAQLASVKPRVYAQGLLVVWSAKSTIKPARDLRFLLADDIRSIAIANPATAPYGAAAVAVLKRYNLYNQLSAKMVTGESISQTSQFIATQNADVGFTAKAIVLSAEMKGKGVWVEVNRNDYPPVLQAAVLLQYGMQHHAPAASKFYEFLYSAAARAIYKKYGYLVTQ